MSGAAESGSSRPRPLSGGFWTLLSWLRRDEQASSTESLSSAGSDRTAVSFAFLAPAHYRAAPPAARPPPGPPSDSYRRRVRDRNLRRHYDRDTTLHRKYGLYRGEAAGGYDALSLPPARRGSGDRSRRAASECAPARAPHVPGKRRAPPPPAAAPAPAARDPPRPGTRRRSRKRPAPRPPSEIIQIAKENTACSDLPAGDRAQMRRRPPCDAGEVRGDRHETECKLEKYTRKESPAGRPKPERERSFLKQIFENRKRNSTVDVGVVRVLPSISELDRQAAEIIESNRVKNIEERNRRRSLREGGCPRCLGGPCTCDPTDKVMPSSDNRSFQNASMCTQTEADSGNTAYPHKNVKEDEKQKLKDMLKEMKDSLPKRPKNEGKGTNNLSDSKTSPAPSEKNNSNTESATIRIGSSSSPEVSCSKTASSPAPCANNKQASQSPKNEPLTLTQIPPLIKINSHNKSKPDIQTEAVINNIPANKQHYIASNDNKKLHTPLKISSLLNPIYVPRNTALNLHKSSEIPLEVTKTDDKVPVKTTLPSDPIYVKTADTVRDIILNSTIPVNPMPGICPPSEPTLLSNKSQLRSTEKPSPSKNLTSSHSQTNSSSTNSAIQNVTNVERLSEHSRRRELVNQLEQSIAKGDERAAAEAATKLAQLRLSCSVLSFSSQILGGPSSSSVKPTGPSISSFQSKDVKNLSDKTSNRTSEPLPDLVTKTKPNQVSVEGARKVVHLDVTKKTISPPLVQPNETNVTVNRISAEASTSKSKRNNENDDDNMTSIKIWIEDKEKARGPIQLHVGREANVGDLRHRAEQSLGLPARLQRWIVGRALCSDDSIPLTSLAGPTLNAPFYLCLVESDTKNAEAIKAPPTETKQESVEVKKNDGKSSDVYSELVNLERQALVPNTEVFECDICMEQCHPGDGVVLRECVHSFCRGCLSDVIRHCEEPTVSCPATGCPGELHEREIRALVTADEYQRWLARGLAAAESGTRNAFHCRTRDCTGWALCEKEVRRFPCPVCKHINCVPCQAIHKDQTCEQYQAKLLEATNKSPAEKTDEGTQALIDGLISRGEALQCPECSAVITKKWGCDWVKCSACKTEICWVTRGRRWGPGGRGDTSGGCRCGIDGKRCHPSCGYCH